MYCPKLSHQAQVITHCPVFCDLTIGYTHYMYLFLRDRFARWSNAHEGATVGAAKRVPYNHLISITKQVFNDELDIRKCSTIHRYKLFKRDGTGRGTRSSMVRE